jgi:hypothetical protein
MRVPWRARLYGVTCDADPVGVGARAMAAMNAVTDGGGASIWLITVA